MDSPREETTVAIAAVRRALQMARTGSRTTHAKEGRDVVTDTDVLVEDMIRTTFSKSFDYPVVGEERGGDARGDGAHWLVDPICGTRNYASGLPLYAVNVALVENARVAASVVGDGASGDILYSEPGRGAWRFAASPTRISASTSSLTVDFSGWPATEPGRSAAADRLALAIRANQWDVRQLATTVSIAYVATGQLAAAAFFATPEQVHTAAGPLLVTEAGGVVSDLDGQPWSPQSGSLLCCATNELHEELLQIAGNLALRGHCAPRSCPSCAFATRWA